MHDHMNVKKGMSENFDCKLNYFVLRVHVIPHEFVYE